MLNAWARIFRALRPFLAALLLALVCGGAGLAQVTTGTVSGTATDSSNAVLPGVKVEIANEGTGLSRTVVTDAAGHYAAPQLSVGNYGAPGARQLGNLARNTLIGPGALAWNPALLKKTALTENTALEFRAEFFNLLNRANLGIPASTVYNGTGAPVGTAGVISTTSTTSRQVQLALKLLF